MLKELIIRNDVKGNGDYLSARGDRLHYGIDYLAKEGEDVIAPETGVLTRVAFPYSTDYSYEGFVFQGDSGIEYKVFYASAWEQLIGQRVQKGHVLAQVQNIAEKYGGGMKNHIHIETKEEGKFINPSFVFKKKITLKRY